VTSNPTGVEQAVSRALRDNLDRLQRTAEELHQAVADLVAACASSRPTNALPPMLRAQTLAASLAAALEVLSRFVTAALQPAKRTTSEQEVLRMVTLPAPEPAPMPTPPPRFIPVPMGQPQQPASLVAEAVREALRREAPAVPHDAPAVPVGAAQVTDVITESATVTPPQMAIGVAEPETEPPAVPAAEAPAPPVESTAEALPEAPAFDVASLSLEQQDMHRRANRVAKVSMQDIKMLRPEQVRLGQEHKDLCVRLRDDIDKAHREYDRRFRPILDQPVDYFYYWMVEILAGGDPEALGEYPYPSPVLRR
jgi:hypothetical protein